MLNLQAQPAALSIDPARSALLLIDMQRDFLEPGGFGESLGNDVSLLRDCIEPCRAVQAAARLRNRGCTRARRPADGRVRTGGS